MGLWTRSGSKPTRLGDSLQQPSERVPETISPLARRGQRRGYLELRMLSLTENLDKTDENLRAEPKDTVPFAAGGTRHL
jgi:hypothetical protein